MQPQTLKGFNDYFAEDVKLREYVMGMFKKVFESYGYEPLETPAVEYAELMKGFSGEEFEKLFYRFEDQGGRDVMLKAEVMMGMCRAVATNLDKITFPYKRYQIQNVWRAENVQKGRLREFTQCDADTIGSSSMTSDAEFIQMGLEVVRKFGFNTFRARISNRKYLTGLAVALGVGKESFYGMCMSLDKIEKIGVEKVRTEMVEVRRIDPDTVEKLLTIVDAKTYNGLTEIEKLSEIEKVIGDTTVGREAINELKAIFEYLTLAEVDPANYLFDPSLARGLAHYTGPIWEFEIVDGGIGSIAGCGRYDNIIGTYVGKGTQIPATGGSFGIERICLVLKDRELYKTPAAIAQVLVTVFDEEVLGESIEVARALRDNGISTMLFPDKVNLGKQFKYADRKQIPVVVVVGPDEVTTGTVVIKDLKNSKQMVVKRDVIAQEVMKLVS